MVELMICPYGVTKHQLTEQMSHKPYGHRTLRGPGHSPEGGCVLREAKSWHFIQMSHKLQLWKRAASCLLEVPFPLHSRPQPSPSQAPGAPTWATNEPQPRHTDQSAGQPQQSLFSALTQHMPWGPAPGQRGLEHPKTICLCQLYQ